MKIDLKDIPYQVIYEVFVLPTIEGRRVNILREWDNLRSKYEVELSEEQEASLVQGEQAEGRVKSSDLDLQGAFAKADKEASLNACPRDIFLFALIQALQDNQLYKAPQSAPDVTALVEALEEIAQGEIEEDGFLVAMSGEECMQVAYDALSAYRKRGE